MPLESIRVTSPLPASAARVYAAWLDAAEHTRMTGAPASVQPKVGGSHTAWDGYIEGKIVALERGERIVQTWRSSEFPPGHAHSRLEIRLRDVPGGCEISVAHSDIPEGQGEKYEKGWHEHYFIPMTKYFRENPDTIRDAPAKPAKAKKAKAKKAAKPKKTGAKAKKSARPKTVKKAAGAKKSAKAKKGAKPKGRAKGKKAAKGKRAAKAK